MKTPKVIAVDMDETLCHGTAWTPQDALEMKPNTGMIEQINKLSFGNFIIIYTARRDSLIENTIKWLRSNNVDYHAISNNKMPADYYIDDKMVAFDKIDKLNI